MPLAAPLKDWLLRDSDPSVRRRVLVNLLGRPEGDPDVMAAASEVGKKGWSARILDLQLPEGQWDNPGTGPHDLYVPKYVAANWRLLVLSDLGVPAGDPRVAKAVRLLIDKWSGPGGALGGTDSEVCITGNAVRMLTRLGYGEEAVVASATDWLVRQQKPDGGWHCFPSETGTLDAWEALAAFAAIPPPKRSAAMQRAIESGVDFYLERRLLKEGNEPYAPWSRLHYPVHYYYDYLVGLDFITSLGFTDDRRLAPALDLLEKNRDGDGRWHLEADHPDIPVDESYQIRAPYYPFILEPAGRPSRWITTTALEVLGRVGRP
jgi:hypothetical protein